MLMGKEGKFGNQEAEMMPITAIYDVSMKKPAREPFEWGELVFYTNQGIGYKGHNEDALVIAPRKGKFYVLDGLGGSNNGTLAAKIGAVKIAELLALDENSDILKNPAVMQECLHEALCNSELAQETILSNGSPSGFAYAGISILGEKLDIVWAGDVRVLVIRKGRVVFATVDEGPREWIFRHIVTNDVSWKSAGQTTTENFKLQDGDIVVVATDGFTDNFDHKVEEGGIPMKNADVGNIDIATKLNREDFYKGVEGLVRETLERMGSAGLATGFKGDNASLVAIRYRSKELGEKPQELADGLANKDLLGYWDTLGRLATELKHTKKLDDGVLKTVASIIKGELSLDSLLSDNYGISEGLSQSLTQWFVGKEGQREYVGIEISLENDAYGLGASENSRQKEIVKGVLMGITDLQSVHARLKDRVRNILNKRAIWAMGKEEL